MNAATSFHCPLPPQAQQRLPPAAVEVVVGHGYDCGADEDDSGSEDDVIDVLSADHCTGEHSYTMQMPASMLLEEERRAYETPELEAARRLVDWLGSPACRKYSAPFLEPLDIEQRPAYTRAVRQPMCLSRVRAALDARAYAGITEVVRDIRLILENCYRFYGPQHHLTKKALRLETVLEQKLALLPRELREKTSLEATTLENRDVGAQRAGRRARLTSQLPTGGESSALLQLVKAEKAAQAREERLKQREERRVEKEVAQQAIVDWESTTFGSGLAELSHCWEVPQLCQFLRLSQEPLQLPDVSIAEVEHSLLMPQKSSLLALLMTCLLVAPQQRPKTLLQHPMPYRVWNERLRSRLQNWYRTYLGSQRNFIKVFEAHGLEEQFFSVMGETDPMESKDFHELGLLQRVWLLKALCDHKLGQHRRVQEWMAEQEADSLREACLGEDRVGRRYLHFPCLAEPRLYRMQLPQPPPTPEREPSPPPPPTPKTSHKSKKKGRQQRSSSRRSSRHRKTKSSAAAAKEECEEEEDKTAEPDAEAKPAETEPAEVKPESTEVEPPPAEAEQAFTEATPTSKVEADDVKEEKPPPDFETVATSVADLRGLITSLSENSNNNSSSSNSNAEDKRPATRKGAAEAEKAEESTERLLLEQLRVLLSEWEVEEAAFQQADVALRTRLHREWHQPDTQETHGGEDAVDSWTMHYKDECLDEDSSSEESMSQEEYNDNVEDQEEAEMQEDGKDYSGWRVLRKRKIALSLPNGLTNLDEEVAASQSSDQPAAQPSSQASRVSFCQASTQTVSSIPPPQRSIPVVPKEPAAKAAVPHILARNSSSALLSTVTPSSTTWIRPFASVRMQADPPKRPTDHHKRSSDQLKRPTKVRSLLEAGITTFSEPARPSTPQTVQAPAAVMPAVVQEQVVMPEETHSAAAVQDGVAEAQSLPLANDVVMEDVCRQDQEQRPSQKAVLVPAVDNSGQEILLHVEYTTLDEASLGNNLQSLPLPTAPPVGQGFPAATPAAQALTGALSGMQNISASSPVVQSLQMAPPVVQNVPMVQSVVQTLPVSSSTMNIPTVPSLVQTLAVTSSAVDVSMASSLVQTNPVTTSTMELSVVPSLVQTFPVTSSAVQPNVSYSACVQNHRRETLPPRQRMYPWWKHSSSPTTTKTKEVPPLAPITTPRKIFKSRNTAAASNNVCSSMDGVVGTVSSAVHTARGDTFVSSQQHQQLIGSNGSQQQLVFVVPQSPPKPQQVVLQQPEVPAVSQDMISQLIPMAQAQSAEEPQQATATVLLQTTMPNTMQTPILLLTSDGRLLQVVQQPS
ncbi:uncharacterized protein [Dermacentor albipictus]|uniref:uncharacterized protein n=1 Tax=Dermacentor albipictus TaxID=60249 RepID=UPI0038FC3876